MLFRCYFGLGRENPPVQFEPVWHVSQARMTATACSQVVPAGSAVPDTVSGQGNCQSWSGDLRAQWNGGDGGIRTLETVPRLLP